MIINIKIPPLKERTDDIIPLVDYYLKNLCKKEDNPVKKISSEAQELLTVYSWAGNVRELQNMINRAYYISNSDTIYKEDLPKFLLADEKLFDNELLSLNYKNAKEQLLSNFELEFITFHFKKNKGNGTKTANECGLDRRSLHRLISKYNIIYKDGT